MLTHQESESFNNILFKFFKILFKEPAFPMLTHEESKKFNYSINKISLVK